MLDLAVLIARLTQGQPPAAMTLATPAAPAATPSQEAPVAAPGAPPESAPPVAPVDAHVVARRVYELFYRDYATTRSRLSRGRW